MDNWLQYQLPKATNKTAFLTGIWSGTVFMTFVIVQALVEGFDPNDYVFLIVTAVALIPTFPFVGGDLLKGEDAWAERVSAGSRHMAHVLKRLMFWLAGTAAGSIPAMILGNLIARIAG